MNRNLLIAEMQNFDWEIKTGDEQKNGSPADIYAETSVGGIQYWMRIDDGNCEDKLENPLFFIFKGVGGDNNESIFEKRINSIVKFEMCMKLFLCNRLDEVSLKNPKKNLNVLERYETLSEEIKYQIQFIDDFYEFDFVYFNQTLQEMKTLQKKLRKNKN